MGLNNRLFNVFYKWANKWYVEKRSFHFARITAIQTNENEHEGHYLGLPKKHDYYNLFNIENTDFSKNLTNEKNIVATVEIDATSSEDSENVQTLSLDDLSSDEKKMVISGQIVGEKNCLNCGESFQYKNKKKMYCSTSCRQSFWEKTNGKKLKRGRVKRSK